MLSWIEEDEFSKELLDYSGMPPWSLTQHIRPEQLVSLYFQDNRVILLF